MNKDNMRKLADHLEQNVKDGYDQKNCAKCLAAHAANLAGYYEGCKTPRTWIASSFLGIDDFSYPEHRKQSQYLFCASPLGLYDPDYKDAVSVLRNFANTGVLDWTVAPGYNYCQGIKEQ